MEKDIVKSSDDNELWMESVRSGYEHSSRPVQGPVGYPLQQPSQHSSTTVAVRVGTTYRSVADLSGSKESIVIATIESLRATENKN